MDELREFLRVVPEPSAPGLAYETAWEDGRRQVEALLSSRKEWPELRNGPDDDSYSAIRLYTSYYGYKKIFNTMNAAFRRPDIRRYPHALRSATFLAELLNIDLYNFIRSSPEANNFEGRIYRSMRVSGENLEDYARVAADKTLGGRYLAAPLSTTSATTTKDKALPFAMRTEYVHADSHALLWDISVHSLDSALLAAYRQSFPHSIVTSLGSVPIRHLSDLPDEGEVMLRSPYFQILRIHREEDSLRGEPLHVVQAVMLNTSRDHITNIATGTGEDKRMRDIFRAMVIASRSARCAEHAESYGLTMDSDYYHNEAAQAYKDFSARI